MYWVGITVFLDCTDFAIRWREQPCWSVKAAGSYIGYPFRAAPILIAILANPYIQEITIVIVLRHPDRVPGDDNLVPVSSAYNIGWSGVKSIGNGQAN